MELLSIFKHTLMICFFVFVMMLFVDFVDSISKRRISDIMKGGRWRQYTLASFFGSTPGCLGAFMNVSLYVHGIPESGPHLIFMMMYAQGLVPFSVLFTASFVQDGHGMLPLLSYSIKDSILIKVFNLAFGIAVGYALFAIGF